RITNNYLTTMALTISSSKLRSKRRFLTWDNTRLEILREYIWLAWAGTVVARSYGPMIVTPYRTTDFPTSVRSQLPPASAAMSTITEPGRMSLTMSSVI